MPHTSAVNRDQAQVSPVIATLDLDFVTMGWLNTEPAEPGLGGGNYEWFPARLIDGRLGWVLSKYVGEYECGSASR